MQKTIDFLNECYRPVNYEKLMAHNPTLIGVVRGLKCYEHPTRGDEAGLIVVYKDKAWQTDFYDLPSVEELSE